VAVAFDPATALQTAVTRRRLASTGKERAVLEAFERRIAMVTGVPITPNAADGWSRPAKALTTLRYLSETLRTLSQAIDGADGAPSPDARDGLAKVEALIPPVLAEWDRVQRAELAALDEQLRQSGAPPIRREY
jgi:hypothetical protein